MNDFIKADKATKIYESSDVKTIALNQASFSIPDGSFTVILGPSGAGKTTLLNLLGGMDSLTSGHLSIAGKDLFGLSNRELIKYRRTEVGFVFQFYNLMPNLTAKENVELAVEVTKNAFKPADILTKVSLKDRMDNFPAQLSGGEQQRVSIARAIAKNPRLLLCDEPTGALDFETGKTILKLLDDYCKNYHKTVIVVTHNAAIKDMADLVIHIRNGQVSHTEVLAQRKKS